MISEILYVSDGCNDPIYETQLSDALSIFKWQYTGGRVLKGTDSISGSYNIITYTEHENLTELYKEYSFRTTTKRWYILFKDDDEFHTAMKALSPINSYNWIWKVNADYYHSYEVTSKGDRRYSPFFMHTTAPDNSDMTLEDYYQLILKGYWDLGYRNGMDVKGKPPLYPDKMPGTAHKVFGDYLRRYKGLFYELALIGLSEPLSDMFDPNGGQNKTYCDILNNYFKL